MWRGTQGISPVFSIDGEYAPDVLASHDKGLSDDLRIASNGTCAGITVRRSSWLSSRSHALKSTTLWLLLPITVGYDQLGGIIVVGGAEGERSCG